MTITTYKKISVFITGILALALLILWSYVYYKPFELNLDMKPIDSLEKSVSYLKEIHPETYDSFYKIPTGLNIDTFEINSVNQITIAGRLWQRYPQDFPLQIGFQINKTANLKTTLLQKKQINNETLYLWHFEGNLYEKINIKKYPFDYQISKVEILPKDLTKEVLLIPDLISYEYLNPTDSIGIGDYDLTNYGFKILQTFFSYQIQPIATNWGDQSVLKDNDQTLLNYNIILKREILNASLIYFLPFMVILSLLFAILIIVQKWLDRSLSGITALIFTLFLLHRMLRASFGASQILYLEYMFITGYLALLFIGFYIVFIFFHQQLKKPDSKRHAVIVHSFWPIVLISWIIITVNILL